MGNLLKEYREALTKTRKEKESAPDYEQKIYSGMITDLEIAISWMETGRPPGAIKGVYGSSPSTAIMLDSEKLAALNYKKGFPVPLDPFEEIENLVDKERRAKQHA